MKFLSFLLIIFVITLFALLALRLWDWRADQIEWNRLFALQPVNPPLYEPSMVANLPESAQRFFNFAISPGTPLLTVAEIDMGGQLSLGSLDDPNYRQMNAQQILAAPDGFVWKLRLPGIMPISGSDSGGWTRFRILGTIPVARIGGDSDHTRSAFGRYVAEALFWTPAALLPSQGINWEKVDENTASVTVNHKDLSQRVYLKVDIDGKPIEVYFTRWSDANPEKEYRFQPFGGKLFNFREVQGFRLPFKVEAGNMYGTDEYFSFFKAEVTSIRYPRSRS